MRQHIITIAQTVNGNTGTGSMHVNVGGDVRTLRLRYGKRLSKACLPVPVASVKPGCSPPAMVAAIRDAVRMPLACSRAAFEPPAAAWASFVIGRAISA